MIFTQDRGLDAYKRFNAKTVENWMLLRKKDPSYFNIIYYILDLKRTVFLMELKFVPMSDSCRSYKYIACNRFKLKQWRIEYSKVKKKS